MEKQPHIVVAGAGSIGCFIGGLLLNAGRKVTLLARPPIAQELSTHGLKLSDFAGLNINLAPDRVAVTTDTACLRDADVVLVTVKSADTGPMAAQCASLCRGDTVFVSLQNGVENAAILSTYLPESRVLGGMVAFNVVRSGEGRFHRGTSGEIVIQGGYPAILSLLQADGLMVTAAQDIQGVQWGKLLMNLNNALNALSNLPLKTQLEDRQWRCLLADQIAEALSILKAAGIKPVPAMPLPPRFLPALLRLPTPVFRTLAARMLKIDPKARSSMWEDLSRGRVTEIDYLQGAVLKLAKARGHPAGITQAIMENIKQAEIGKSGSPGLTPAQVRAPPALGRDGK
jgi:2-dehydropantoate 2-reductase